MWVFLLGWWLFWRDFFQLSVPRNQFNTFWFCFLVTVDMSLHSSPGQYLSLFGQGTHVQWSVPVLLHSIVEEVCFIFRLV